MTIVASSSFPLRMSTIQNEIPTVSTSYDNPNCRPTPSLRNRSPFTLISLATPGAGFESGTIITGKFYIWKENVL